MLCAGCGNDKAYRQVIWHEKDEDGKLHMFECCDRCDGSGMTGSNLEPDVYVQPGVPEENLPDDPRTGKAPVFYSKREMAGFLKERGMVQVRDKEHGGVSIPQSFTGNGGRVDRSSRSWHESRMQVKHIREMGIDQRRQAYLKAVKGL